MRKQIGTMRGFTLVELLVVFSVMGMLAVLGIAAFVDYSRSQTVATAALEFANMLQVARSRAQSQVKPETPVCNDNTLDGYAVIVCPYGADGTTLQKDTYQLGAACGGAPTEETLVEKKLPSPVVFECTDDDSGYGSGYVFRVISGAVEFGGGAKSGGSLVIKGYGKQRTVTVYEDGRIVTQ